MIFGAFQNFKDKFLGRGGGPITSFQLAAYGKLPIYKDYILWECHQPLNVEFKRWLDDAFGLPWDEFNGKGVTLRGPARAVLFMPSGKSAVALSIWPSADENHLRKFPFCLFTVFQKNEIAGRGFPAGITALDPIWRALEDQYVAVTDCRKVEELYSYLQATNAQAPEPTSDVEIDFDLASWLSALGRTVSSDNGAAVRPWLEGELRAFFETCRSYPEQAENLAVRLPLAPDYLPAVQAGLWAQVFQLNVRKLSAFPSVIFECAASPAGRCENVILSWRAPRREDARLFGEQIDGYKYLENFVPVGDQLKTASAQEAEDLTFDQWATQLGK